MAVSKINGFRAPYRSDTFRQIADAQTQRNGLVAIDGVITQTGPNLTVPAITFIQQGMLVKKTTTTTFAMSSMDAPFFLVVSAPTSVQTDDLVFSYAKSPADITTSEAIIAAWDGVEWRYPTLLSLDGVYTEVNQANIDFDLVGPFSGLNTSVDGPDYRNTAGTVVDKQGLRQTMVEDNLFPIPVDDPDWSRVDRVIYRRPNDSENRIGTRKFFVGGTYDAAPATLYDTQAFDSTKFNNKTKVVVGADNTAYMFTSSGSAGVYEIRFKRVASDRTTILTATTTILTGLTSPEFDVVVDSSNVLYLVFVQSGNIRRIIFDNTGAVVVAALTIDTQSGACDAPAIALSADETTLFVAYHSLVGVGQNQIFLTSFVSGGSVALAPVNITSNAFNLKNPSIAVTDDFYVYVAWENVTNTKVAYRLYDDIGVALAAEVTVSSATNRIGFGTLVDAAKSPKIWATDNKNVVVAFLQDKGGVNYGLSVWTNGSAIMQQLITAGENFDRFDMSVDPIFNGLHLVVSRSTNVDFVKLRGETVDFILPLAATGSAGVSVVRDVLGSILTLWSESLTGSFTSYDSGNNTEAFGPGLVTPTEPPFTLNSDEFVIYQAAATPAVGDQVVISGSGEGNDGSYSVLSITSTGLLLPNDAWIIKVTPAFPFPDLSSPAALADFQSPDVNEARFVKSTAETQAHAYVLDELDTDVLLSRIVSPGSIILNYPSGGGGLSGMDALVPFGASVSIDWEATTPGELTIAGGIQIQDLLNNFTYSLADGNYAMVEDDALYVELDGVNFSPTPQVTSIATLPFSQPIFVLGIIKAGEFNPHLLGRGGMGQLDSGETIIFGSDLSDIVRTRLGITGENSYTPYSSTIAYGSSASYPNAISNLDLMAGQNKNIRLVRGQVSWANPNADELVFEEDSYLQVPGLPEARNKIAAQTINLTADGQVAYVDVNRTTGVNASLTVSVALISAVVPGRNTIILARRVGTELIIEANGSTKMLPGTTLTVGETVFEENLTLQLKPHPSNTKRVILTGADGLKPNTIKLSNLIGSLLIDFDGAEIDFDTGTVYKSDGVTVLGTNFTPATIAAGQYRWYSVSFVPDVVTADNRINIKLIVTPATSDGSTADLADRAAFAGMTNIGQVVVQESGGSIAAIGKSNLVQIAPGASGSSLTLQRETPTGVVDGVNFVFTLADAPLAKDATFVFRDGLYVPEVEWSLVNGDEIHFVTPPALAQTIEVSYFPDPTGLGGGGGGSVDLTNITVDPQPSVDGAQSLGTSTKRWSGLFLRDVTTGDTYRLEVDNGILQAVLVP